MSSLVREVFWSWSLPLFAGFVWYARSRTYWSISFCSSGVVFVCSLTPLASFVGCLGFPVVEESAAGWSASASWWGAALVLGGLSLGVWFVGCLLLILVLLRFRRSLFVLVAWYLCCCGSLVW